MKRNHTSDVITVHVKSPLHLASRVGWPFRLERHHPRLNPYRSETVASDDQAHAYCTGKLYHVLGWFKKWWCTAAVFTTTETSCLCLMNPQRSAFCQDTAWAWVLTRMYLTTRIWTAVLLWSIVTKPWSSSIAKIPLFASSVHWPPAPGFYIFQWQDIQFMLKLVWREATYTELETVGYYCGGFHALWKRASWEQKMIVNFRFLLHERRGDE